MVVKNLVEMPVGHKTRNALRCAVLHGDIQFTQTLPDFYLAHVGQWDAALRTWPARRVPPNEVVTNAESPDLVRDERKDETEA